MKTRTLIRLLLMGLAILALHAPPLSAQTKKEKEQAKKLEETANKAFAQKDYATAAATYGQSLALVANNPRGHYSKGFAHFNLKEYDKAVSEFTLALSQGFTPPLEIYRTRAYIYKEQKNYDAAIADIQKALTLAPRDLPLMKGLGEAYLLKSDIPAAREALIKASAAAPNDADIHYNLAQVYLATGDVKLQGVEADLALAKGTRFPGEAFNLLADARLKQRDIPGAIEAYQRAIQSKPELHDVYRTLSEIFRSEGRLNEAIETSKKGLIAFPNDGYFYTDLSWYYSLSDRPDDAVNAAKAGISQLPNVYTAYTNLCRAYNDIKQYDQAITACNQALKLNPGDGETYFYLGRAFILQGRTAEANTAFKKAVAGLSDYTGKNPGYSDGYYLLGNAYLSDGQRDKAIETYLQCLKISPRFVKAKVNLGIAYVFKKNKAAALEQYEGLMKLDTVNAAKLKAEIDKM